jgi:hypothetical protein
MRGDRLLSDTAKEEPHDKMARLRVELDAADEAETIARLREEIYEIIVDAQLRAEITDAQLRAEIHKIITNIGAKEGIDD